MRSFSRLHCLFVPGKLEEIRNAGNISKAKKKRCFKKKNKRAKTWGEKGGNECFRGALLVLHVSTIVGSVIDWVSPSSLSGILDSPPIEGRVVWC